MYFLPLIKAHTDALLGGHLLRVLWPVGAGWSPWENAQAGVFYLPYHLANLLARAIGHPLALLEVSAWLHLAGAALVAHAFVPADRTPSERLGWAAGAMLIPGPLLLGLNWHNYLSCYPWFLALAFLLRRSAGSEPPGASRADRLRIGLASLGFFLSAHAQMYVLGIGLLAAWTLAEAPGRATRRTLVPFALAQLPYLLPLVYLKLLAGAGTPDWMQERTDPGYLLHHAQTLSSVLHGTVLGNLLYTKDFQIWSNIAWTGVGMFFAPFLVLLVRPLWRERRLALGGFFLACLMFMGAASFPWIRHLGAGPLAGFRWTWKLSVFVGPLALASLLPRFRPRGPWPAKGVLWLSVGLSLAVFLRGLSFEIWPALGAGHRLGAAGLVQETRTMARAVGLPPGSRIALLGLMEDTQPMPLPMLGLVGNAPVLAGLGTAHVYEPMEPDWVGRAHFNLTLPWRTYLSVDNLLAKRERFLQVMGENDVRALVTLDPRVAALPGCRSYTDADGATLWVVPTQAPGLGRYPAAPGASLTATASGVLLAPATDAPPRILSPRPVAWRRTGQGGWVGTPDGVPWGWAFPTLLLGAVALVALAWNGRNRVPPGGE
jgi:hypothetical protein